MGSNSVPVSKLAPAPFDQCTTDLVLRSSDGVEFHVFSQILIVASPIFKNMLSDAQPSAARSVTTTDSIDPETPVVPLSEDSDTLDALLRIVYPIEKPNKARTLTDIPPVLEAALKYIMEWPTSVLKQELLSFVADRPLQVWAIACQHGLEDVARRAAERQEPHLEDHVPSSIDPIPQQLPSADHEDATAGGSAWSDST